METSIADRLKEAIKLANRSIRSVQRELHKAGVPGSSYANVHAYFSGKTQPSVGFLREAATALRVNPEWLAFERGHRTPEEADAATIGNARSSKEDTGDLSVTTAELEVALQEGLPALSRAGPASWHAIAELYAEYVRFHLIDVFGPPARAGIERVASGLDHDPVAYKREFQQAQLAAAKRAAAIVGATASAAEIDLSELSRWGLDRYIQITVQAASILLQGTPAGLETRGD